MKDTIMEELASQEVKRNIGTTNCIKNLAPGE
jgi:hypothetical protein